MSVKNAIIKAKVEGQIKELMFKTNVDNVFLADGTTTLATQLAEILTTLGNKADSTAVTQEIANAIDGLIDGAPGTYDTLKEIADYINAHEEVAEALNEAIGNKVDKEEGKGLSTNDFTDVLKARLEGIAEGAEVNQNAFSKVTVGDVTIESTDKTDTVKFEAGENVTLTADAAKKSVKIDVTVPEVVVDNTLSETSENSVQNKVLTAKFAEVAQAIEAKPNTFIQATEPENLKENDIWFQIV